LADSDRLKLLVLLVRELAIRFIESIVDCRVGELYDNLCCGISVKELLLGRLDIFSVVDCCRASLSCADFVVRTGIRVDRR